MAKNTNGPVRINRPAESYQSCKSCEFYKATLVHSGNRPLYSHNCNHADAEKVSNLRSVLLSLFGNLENDDVTPHWCPFLKSNQDAINA